MNVNDAETVFASLLDKVPWGIELTIGTRLSLEFGKEVLRPKHKQAHGEWHLLFQNCHWRVENAESLLVGSDDDDLSAGINKLKFGKVVNIRLIVPSSDLEIQFDHGLRLITFATYSMRFPESNQWYLFCADGSVLIAEGGGHLTRKDRNES